MISSYSCSGLKIPKSALRPWFTYVRLLVDIRYLTPQQKNNGAKELRNLHGRLATCGRVYQRGEPKGQVREGRIVVDTGDIFQLNIL